MICPLVINEAEAEDISTCLDSRREDKDLTPSSRYPMDNLVEDGFVDLLLSYTGALWYLE